MVRVLKKVRKELLSNPDADSEVLESITEIVEYMDGLVLRNVYTPQEKTALNQLREWYMRVKVNAPELFEDGI